jgi:predicted DNA-binding protein (UPF0278 family)
MFKGSIVAIITPFKDGKIDEETYRELIAKGFLSSQEQVETILLRPLNLQSTQNRPVPTPAFK